MTIKEQLANALVEDGYDFLTACEHAHNFIKEFKQSNKTETYVATQKRVFRLSKDGQALNIR